jgi:hypothetical protein
MIMILIMTPELRIMHTPIVGVVIGVVVMAVVVVKERVTVIVNHVNHPVELGLIAVEPENLSNHQDPEQDYGKQIEITARVKILPPIDGSMTSIHWTEKILYPLKK